jgi:hypothetical protein
MLNSNHIVVLNTLQDDGFCKSSSSSKDIIVILATAAEEKIMPRPAGDAARFIAGPV